MMPLSVLAELNRLVNRLKSCQRSFTYEVLHALGSQEIPSNLLLESLVLVDLVEDKGTPES